MTTTALEPQRSSAGASSEIVHFVCCCDDDLAICSANVADEPWCVSEEDVECVVCDDLWPDGADCPRCGCPDC